MKHIFFNNFKVFNILNTKNVENVAALNLKNQGQYVENYIKSNKAKHSLIFKPLFLATFISLILFSNFQPSKHFKIVENLFKTSSNEVFAANRLSIKLIDETQDYLEDVMITIINSDNNVVCEFSSGNILVMNNIPDDEYTINLSDIPQEYKAPTDNISFKVENGNISGSVVKDGVITIILEKKKTQREFNISIDDNEGIEYDNSKLTFQPNKPVNIKFKLKPAYNLKSVTVNSVKAKIINLKEGNFNNGVDYNLKFTMPDREVAIIFETEKIVPYNYIMKKIKNLLLNGENIIKTTDIQSTISETARMLSEEKNNSINNNIKDKISNYNKDDIEKKISDAVTLFMNKIKEFIKVKNTQN